VLLHDTTLLVIERCAIYNLELNKLSFISGLSRKYERIAKSDFSQRQQVGLPAFSSHYLLNAKEGICEYPLVIYR